MSPIIVAWSLVAAPAEAEDADIRWHPVDQIVAVAEAYYRQQFQHTDTRIVIDGGNLDARLRLARCPEPLEAFTQGRLTPSSRAVIGVRCSGEKPWKVFVPLNVSVLDRVATARRPLPSGHRLTADDVMIEERDISRLSGRYFSDIAAAVGLELKQPVRAGGVIAPNMLVARTLISRGQSVTLLARASGLTINMAGIALSDGQLDERIRVRNAESGRVIEGVVRSPEIVEVLVR